MFRVYVRRFHVPVATYFSVVPILILLLAGCVFAAYVNRLRARRRRRPEATWHWRGPDFLALFALRAITAAAFGRILTAPFVFDDYTHIAEASGSAWPAILKSFGPAVPKPGLFFRPFGFLLYRLNYLWVATISRAGTRAASRCTLPTAGWFTCCAAGLVWRAPAAFAPAWSS